ncbi:hypothetical protein, partial [Pseudomonas sp. L-22-4S-12]|uniref:hypothetical protein n=1 Tax=Pseudomonas sp. L-22-4S-12 TaxID=2610893 RepID=UPI001C49C69A
ATSFEERPLKRVAFFVSASRTPPGLENRHSLGARTILVITPPAHAQPNPVHTGGIRLSGIRPAYCFARINT